MYCNNGATNSQALAGVKGVIFDCDGVLFDSKASNTVYYNLIRERLGLGPMTASQEKYVHMHTVNESLAHIVPPKKWEELETVRKQVSYVKEILPHLQMEPGLVDFLTTLRSFGLPMAIYTNRTTTMELVLERYELAQYFFPVMTAGNACAKPHPEGAHVILRHWSMRPEDVVFIGDSMLDQLAAEAAGLPFWAYRSPGLRAKLHISDFWSLRALFLSVFNRADG